MVGFGYVSTAYMYYMYKLLKEKSIISIPPKSCIHVEVADLPMHRNVVSSGLCFSLKALKTRIFNFWIKRGVIS